MPETPKKLLELFLSQNALLAAMRLQIDGGGSAAAVPPLVKVPPDMSVNPEWLLFSDLELRVIRAVGDAELSADEIAAKTGENVSGRLRTILSNLVSRRVLIVDREGYRVVWPQGFHAAAE